MNCSTFSPAGKSGKVLRTHEKVWVQRILADDPNLFGAFADREGNTLFKTMWHGEFPGKLLTGLALLYTMTGDETTRRTGDALADGLINTQAADGYLGPWCAARRFEGCTDNDFSHWGDWDTYGRWDTWGHYHCIYGLYRWYLLTGRQDCLCACTRALDLIYEHFIAAGRSLVLQNWAECNLAIGHAFALLYRETGKPEYLQAAKHIVHTEWDAEYFDYYTRKKLCCGWLRAAQSGIPFGRSGQPRWEGLYSLQTLAALYEVTRDTQYRDAACALWQDMAATDRHNTGSFGTGEGATGDVYGAGSETCNTVAWTAFSTDVLRMTRDPRIADELELSLFNAAFGSLLAGERNFTYMNDSDGSRTPAREVLKEQSFEGARDMSCCQANGTRGLAQAADWALLCEKDTMWLNWYGACRMHCTVQDTAVQLEQQTAYPEQGAVRIVLHPAQPVEFTLQLRIPQWSQHTSLLLNGSPCPDVRPGSYYTLKRVWQAEDTLTLTLDMSPHFWPHTQQQKFSVYRGPLLLARRTQDKTVPRRFSAESFADAVQLQTDALTAWQVTDSSGKPCLFTDYYTAGKDGGSFTSWIDAEGSLPQPADTIWCSR
ncbi:MAG: glycoside hydrolase family 127 protein [Oscillospiraceae bacterium]|nr:glycoside hydrolase family 127 protein [Oscillospiraceae bacterium]